MPQKLNGIHFSISSSSTGQPRAGAARRRCALLAIAAFAGCVMSSGALAQPLFSIDFQGPKGMPSTFPGTPISEGDILMAATVIPTPGPLPFPASIFLPGANPGGFANLGLPAYVFGPLPAGVPGLVEVDAISFGTDYLLTPAAVPDHVWSFSVDEFASGFPSPAPPNVFTEGVFGAGEASADVFIRFPALPMPPAPVPPFAAPPSSTLLFDGNGVPAPGAPPPPPIPGLLGFGLLEPNPPTPGAIPDLGMNLDAMDVDSLAAIGIFFSLDSAFPDPLEPGANSGSAMANGFVGGDVLMSPPGPVPVPVVYAPAMVLGLDLIAGPDSDDLDALVLVENGIAGYQPSLAPYDWLGGATDMLLFSVRRGSALIGAPDSLLGLPICEGDILTTPLAGGVSPFPGIFIAAENLGLNTFRSMPAPIPFPPFSDDLDALDVSPDCNMNSIPDFFDIGWGFGADCNGNSMLDACEIASGIETDCNCNGVPDSCDIVNGLLVDTDGDGIPNACECRADISGPNSAPDNSVNIDDMLAIITVWGACPPGPCIGDIAPVPCGDGIVDINDLLQIITDWGGCP